jgi:hypothetical protein
VPTFAVSGRTSPKHGRSDTMAKKKKKSRRRRAVSVTGDLLAAGCVIDGLIMGSHGGSGPVPIATEIRGSVEALIQQYVPQIGSEAAQNILSGMAAAMLLKKGASALHRQGINPRIMGFTV